jgi:uncharacterized membrane protein YagU involved in acid resistance
MDKRELLEDLVVGAIGGLLATVPMTIFMHAVHHRLPPGERYALPPKRITRRLGNALRPTLKEYPPRWDLPTYAGHFGYGTAAGAVFGALAHRSASTVRNAVGFGLAVWTASYLGWLPVVGLHPSATRDTARRNALMIAAHVVWGATLGMVVASIRARRSLPRRRPADTDQHTHARDRTSRRPVRRA